MRQKIKKFDVVYIIVVLVFAIGGLCLPKSGQLALLDVAFDNILLWGLAVYLFLKVKKLGNGIRKNLYVYIICAVLGIFGIFSTRNLIMDVILGPKVIELHHVNKSQLQGIKGIAFLHYYLQGNDSEGKKYKIEISADEYMRVGTSQTVVITYYENTKRLYKFGGIE